MVSMAATHLLFYPSKGFITFHRHLAVCGLVEQHHRFASSEMIRHKWREKSPFSGGSGSPKWCARSCVCFFRLFDLESISSIPLAHQRKKEGKEKYKSSRHRVVSIFTNSRYKLHPLESPADEKKKRRGTYASAGGSALLGSGSDAT